MATIPLQSAEEPPIVEIEEVPSLKRKYNLCLEIICLF
jgi:hypothetical protein